VVAPRPAPQTAERQAQWQTRLTSARFGALALGLTALALSAAPALGDSTAPRYAKVKQRFTTTESGASTGWSFDGGPQRGLVP
jgi:hypothetical protein